MQSMVQSAKKVYTIIFTAQWAITFSKRLKIWCWICLLNLSLSIAFELCIPIIPSILISTNVFTKWYKNWNKNQHTYDTECNIQRIHQIQQNIQTWLSNGSIVSIMYPFIKKHKHVNKHQLCNRKCNNSWQG